MSVADINDPKTLKKLIYIMADSIGAMQEIINKLDGPIPQRALSKLIRLADRADKIKSAN